MNPTLVVKTGDKYPTTWTTPLDLSGATVRLIARRHGFDPVILATTIIDENNGVVQHILDGTLALGNYLVELEITRGAEIITAPTDAYENLRVIPDLD